VEDVVLWLMVNTKVAVESHPTEFKVEYVYVPLDVYGVPFQVYESQAVTGVEDVVLWLIVNTNVAVESHPTEFKVE
jgi:ribosomal protein L39E